VRQESAKTFLFALLWVYYYALPLSIPRIVSLINPRKAIPALIPESIDQIISD
jgi:hypothetical protein